MKFKQAKVHDSARFFKKNFMKRWDFDEYHDVDKPLVFFGIKDLDDLYENHKSYKIIIPTTSHTRDLPDFKRLKNNDKTILVIDENIYSDYYIPENVIVKNEVIELKDYSIFKPSVMGDKIYYYSGFKNGWSDPWRKDLINEIQKNINYEIITTSHNNINDYSNINDLKENFYDRCFLNLNLSKDNGMTTVREMGLMGRKTIKMKESNKYDYSCIINCDNIEDIIKNINKESKKIGTLQDSMNSHTVDDEWLNLNYWL